SLLAALHSLCAGDRDPSHVRRNSPRSVHSLWGSGIMEHLPSFQRYWIRHGTVLHVGVCFLQHHNDLGWLLFCRVLSTRSSVGKVRALVEYEQ
ncbi:hypothetical protein BaRGS_00035699, partial [Batillaria attramentaria]